MKQGFVCSFRRRFETELVRRRCICQHGGFPACEPDRVINRLEGEYRRRKQLKDVELKVDTQV